VSVIAKPLRSATTQNGVEAQAGGIYNYTDKLQMCRFPINFFMSPLDYEASKQVVAVNVVTACFGKRLAFLSYKKLRGIFKTKI
jgi:hypothetical protein